MSSPFKSILLPAPTPEDLRAVDLARRADRTHKAAHADALRSLEELQAARAAVAEAKVRLVEAKAREARATLTNKELSAAERAAHDELSLRSKQAPSGWGNPRLFPEQ